MVYKIRNFFSILLPDAIAGAGIYFWQQSKIETVEAELAEVQMEREDFRQQLEEKLSGEQSTFYWSYAGLHFDYPAGYSVLDYAASLTITDKAGLSLVNTGESAAFLSRFESHPNETIASFIEEYEDEMDFEKGSETFGENTFTTVTLMNELLGKEMVHYLMEADSKLLEFTAVEGLTGNNEPLTMILETLSTESEEIQPPQTKDDSTAKQIIVTDKLAKSDTFSLGNETHNDPLLLKDDELFVNVGYSGGCAEHEFDLTWDGAFNDDHVSLYLIHDAQGDTCEAYINQTLVFDISEIKERSTVESSSVFIELYRSAADRDIVMIEYPIL